MMRLPPLAMLALYHQFCREVHGVDGMIQPVSIPLLNEFCDWLIDLLLAPFDEYLPAHLMRPVDNAFGALDAIALARRPAHIPPISWDAPADYDFHICRHGAQLAVAWPVSLAALRPCLPTDHLFGKFDELPNALSDAGYRIVHD